MIRPNVLTDKEIEAIHQATLRILSEVGIVLAHPKTREVLTRAGAKVRDDRVLLSPDLVERMGIIERAQAEVKRLLTDHQVPPLTEEQERELEEIMWEAERELGQD